MILIRGTDQKPHPPPEVAREVVFRSLKSFFSETKIHMFAIDGNHGVYSGYRASTLDTLKIAFPKLHVFTRWDLWDAIFTGKSLYLDFGDVRIHAFPYITSDIIDRLNLTYEFNSWVVNAQRPAEDKINIAVVHGMTIDNSLNPRILNNGYDYIALGHDHRMHKISEDAWYSGSTERWRFDEYGHPKGFLIAQVESGEPAEVKEIHMKLERPMYVKRIQVDSDLTSKKINESVMGWIRKLGLVGGWNSKTGARLKFVFEGKIPFEFWKVTNELELLRRELLGSDDYNVVQVVWDWKTARREWIPPAFQDEAVEYLIGDPKEDFEEYLKTIEIEKSFDPEVLIKIASKAIKKTLEGGKRADRKSALEEL
ncbi:MAG: exonuclease SbcCD subunit D [Candidatus Hodarchaeota archaeon]